MKKSLVLNDIINHPDFKDELNHLKNTKKEMLKKIEHLESENRKIHTNEKELIANKDKESIRELYNNSFNRSCNSRNILKIKSALKCPYFGRVDFKDEKNSESESLYIGKVGFNSESKYGVIDWRMPIASIFYETENRSAQYETPDGIVSVDIDLKRKYTIENSQLISFIDDIIADKIYKTIKGIGSKRQYTKDDVLSNPISMEKLKQNSNKKLKDIIETIKAEQNKIIRQPLNTTLVIQGVAGSGKSEVGLHRISYILYNNKKIDPNKILVITPNKVFQNYISDILPNLDIDEVTQLTFEELALNLLGNMRLSNAEVSEFILNAYKENFYQILKEYMVNISKFKGSLSFIKLVDYIINKKTKKIISELKDINLFGEKLKIGKEEQINYLTSSAPLNKKIKSLKKAINFKVKVFIEKQAFFSGNDKRLKQEYDTLLNSYLKKFERIEPICIYKEIFEDDHICSMFYKHRYFSFIAQYTLKVLESGYVERDDLAILCYIKYAIDGIRPRQKYKHILIDEAQDLSPLEFVVLKFFSENNSMTIMGDMNQGINSYRGIKDWKELIDIIYCNFKPQYFEILSNYRSTKEIVEFSNKLVSNNLPKAKPIGRDGEKPIVEKFLTYKDGIKKVIDLINHYKDKGCRSIGILAKTKRECRIIYTMLQKQFDKINLLDYMTDKYYEEISIVPIVLSKGLEFDAVILWNASDEIFGDSEFDLKVLYVAVTRPTNYLHILYKGSITTYLKELV